MQAAFQSHSGAIAAAKLAGMGYEIPEFQSHSGAIAAVEAIHLSPQQLLRFNPTVVRLLPQRNSPRPASVNGFNPTVVRLLPVINARFNFVGRSFNPTVVRLLPSRTPTPDVSREFQSHSGAIAA